MDLDEKFDLIILKDVIEHIPDQERFIPFLRKFLSKDGVVMFGFPPWYMPFGGHQQICRNKWLSKIPWYHLLPISLYKRLLKWGGESIATIEGLVDIKKTGITIDRLKRILKKEKFLVIAEKYWLFNPIYKWKFGIYPKAVAQPFTRIPYLRNFYTSAFYILFK
jgi:SAM-dependent methyltransferase